MLDYDFIKIADEYMRLCKELPLPALIADMSFQVYASNQHARSLFAHITEPEGLRRVLAEYEAEKISEHLRRNGGYTIRNVFLLSEVDMSFAPVTHGGEVVGALVLLMRSGAALGPDGHNQTNRAATALATVIRDSASDIFATMDTAAAKADLLDAGWVNVSLSRLSLHTYRILRQVGNIAEYAKYQSGTVHLALRAVDVFEVLRESGAIVEDICHAWGVPFAPKIPDEACFVQLDISHFEIAVFNILHNGLYFTRPGNEITVRAWRQGGFAHIAVQDKGLGIPGHMLGEVCKPYVTCRRHKASATIGLGLTLAQIIMEAHGGRLEIASQENEGTTVTLHLPESAFSQGIPLEQRSPKRFRAGDRFSAVYTGLSDIPLSPYRE